MGKRSTKRLDFTYREKAISTDLNRAFGFVDAALLEVLRYALFTTTPTFSSHHLFGLHVESASPLPGFVGYTTKLAPMFGEVLGGLVCTMQPGSLTFTLSDGAILAVDPDPTDTADDSPLRLGLGGAGSYTITPNSSGSTRVDVVEVAIAENITETKSIDVYNPDTGAFTPELADKVAYGALAVRVRAGTPGGGTPAGVEGYMPLYLVTVPTGVTTTFEQSTGVVFWDVRPFLQQRIGFGIQNSLFAPDATTYVESVSLRASDVGPSVDGSARVVLNGRHIGGRVIDPLSGGTLDLSGTNSNAGGYTPGSNQQHFTYLTVPIMAGSTGHPWYNGSGVVLPQGGGFRSSHNGSPPLIRSLPVFSNVTPTFDGTAFLSAPTWTGLGSVKGVCVAWSNTDVGGNVYPFVTSGKSSQHTGITINGAHGGGALTWTLSTGIHYPANATSLTVVTEFNIKTAGVAVANLGYVSATAEFDSSGQLAYLPEVHPLPQPSTAGALSFTVKLTFRVNTPRGTGAVSLRVTPSFGGASHSIDTGIMCGATITEITL